MRTERQVSAGGVVYRRTAQGIEIAIIRTGPTVRWQLPKGLVERGEPPEEAALREVREEAGVEAELAAPLDSFDYWYVSGSRGGGDAEGERVRYHKVVHFFLMRYRGGDVRDHDHEVEEARWVAIDEALEMLTFGSERRIVELAGEMIALE